MGTASLDPRARAGKREAHRLEGFVFFISFCIDRN